MDAFDNPLPDWVIPGTSFRLVYSPTNPNNKKYHIRGIVDGAAVVRWWRPRVQDWEYTVRHPWWFHLMEDKLRDIKAGKTEEVV